MSEELWKGRGEVPHGTRFWGGAKRGLCLQLTKGENYITISYDAIPKLIIKLDNVYLMYGMKKHSKRGSK